MSISIPTLWFHMQNTPAAAAAWHYSLTETPNHLEIRPQTEILQFLYLNCDLWWFSSHHSQCFHQIQIGSLTRTPAENPTWQRPLCNLLLKKYNLVQLTLVFYAWQLESKKRILELDFLKDFLHIFHFLLFFCCLFVYKKQTHYFEAKSILIFTRIESL